MKAIVEANPQLDWWFQDIEKTFKKIKTKAEACKALAEGNDQKLVLNEHLFIIFPQYSNIIYNQIIYFCSKSGNASRNSKFTQSFNTSVCSIHFLVYVIMLLLYFLKQQKNTKSENYK